MDGHPNQHSLWAPVGASLLAGAGTAVGGALVFVLPTTPPDAVIAFSLSVAGGVMTVVSVVDLIAPVALAGGVGPVLLAALCVAAGCAIVTSLRTVRLPEPEELALTLYTDVRGAGARGTEAHASGGGGGGSGKASPPPLLSSASSSSSLSFGDGAAAGSLPLPVSSAPPAASPSAVRRRTWRLGLLLWATLSAHNLPEGVAVGVGVEKSAALGGVLTIAVLVHNIAEGIVVAVPLLAATGDRRFAFLATAVSGLTEPVGAALGVILLRWFLGVRAGAHVGGSSGGSGDGSSGDGEAAVERVLNVVLCVVAGVMIQVSVSELLPQALRFGGRRTVAAGVATGASVILATGALMGE